MGSVPQKRGATDGQVLIEVLLILPVFMLLIFMIMQIGFFSFQAIVTHHGAYEVARIASLTAEKVPITGMVQSSVGEFSWRRRCSIGAQHNVLCRLQNYAEFRL